MPAIPHHHFLVSLFLLLFLSTLQIHRLVDNKVTHLISLYSLSPLTLHTTITCVCACFCHHAYKREMGEKKWPASFV
jgi:uncharacterized membrane protein YhaH (DUF805 family)